MNSWEFNLEQTVAMRMSAETGTVVGRAEYSHMENQYLVRYKAADGRQVEAWWGASALE